jgi:hypothetical protein
MKRQPLTTEQLQTMLRAEIEKHGLHVYSQRRATIEEMLRMRGVKLA